MRKNFSIRQNQFERVLGVEVFFLVVPNKSNPLQSGLLLFGWGTRIRTWVDGVRVRSPAARRSPNSDSKDSVLSERIKPGASPADRNAC
jgi:hypothetical protein